MVHQLRHKRVTKVGAACSLVANIVILSGQLYSTVFTCVYRTPLLNEIKLQLGDTVGAQCTCSAIYCVPYSPLSSVDIMDFS